MLVVLATALLPVFILGWWIYRKDSMRPEPLPMLFKAFLFGVGSTLVTMILVTPLQLLGLVDNQMGSVTDAVSTALFAAAIPEETAKLIMLWLFLRNNKYYDECLDGIVLRLKTHSPQTSCRSQSQQYRRDSHFRPRKH